MSMQLQLLGTGSAAQVPVYNCACMACERARNDARYRRGPSCALLECGEQRWLIDSGLPDLTERFSPGSLSGIFQTHYHADHAQGLLHLRWGKGLRIPVIGPADPEGLADLYKHPGILDFSLKGTAFQAMSFGDLAVTPVPLAHSRPTHGYVFESAGRRIAYLTDTLGLPEATKAWLQSRPLDLLVLDCSFAPLPQAPRNHNDLTHALQIVRELTVAKTVLTHIGHDFDVWLADHADLLPDDVHIARDGDRHQDR